MRRLCDETDARRLLNPGPVAIVTAAWRGMTNAAPVAWTHEARERELRKSEGEEGLAETKSFYPRDSIGT